MRHSGMRRQTQARNPLCDFGDGFRARATRPGMMTDVVVLFRAHHVEGLAICFAITGK
jgi:hypothetical protein